MKKYLWSVHVSAGVLAIFESILTVSDFSRMGRLFAVLSVVSLVSLVAIYIAEHTKLGSGSK